MERAVAAWIGVVAKHEAAEGGRNWRSRSVFLPRLALLAALGAAGLMSPSADADGIDPSYIYGIDDLNVIYQINPVPDQQSFGSVYNTGLTAQSNAFAFDRDRDQMFFLNVGTGNANNLHLWNKPLGTFSQIATGSQLGVSGTTIPANAAYYSDAFWFFKERTNELVKAPLLYSSTSVGTVPTLGTVETFTITPAPAIGGTTSGARNAFGDIAIVDAGPGVGTLYGYTAGAQGGNFYSLDLNTASSGTVGGFSLISSGTIVSGTAPIGLQISFNEDYTVLYGHNYNDGKWYDVNVSNGFLTDLNFSTTTNGTTGFRDIGGASIVSVPEPAAFVLVAAGGVAVWLGRLGRRRRRT